MAAGLSSWWPSTSSTWTTSAVASATRAHSAPRALLLDDRCPDPLYRKAVRTSLGTVLEVPWVQAPIRDLMEALAAAGVITVGLTPDVGAATIAEVAAELAADAPVALVIGNEGHGLSAGTRARCARLARIPMAEGADSLNVATALAVALYEWRVRQH